MCILIILTVREDNLKFLRNKDVFLDLMTL